MANPQTHDVSNPEPLWPTNARWVNGVAPGYWPTNGGGLVLDLSAGTSNNSGIIVSYAGGTLTMANNTTNYVFLDSASSYAPGSNTSGFTSAHVAIATVVTLSGAITAITDHRLAATVGGGGGTPGGSNHQVQINSSGSFAGIATGTAGQYLRSGGASADPAFASIAESEVTSLVSDLALKAPLASPALTGTPTAPTAAGGTNTTQIATTAFVIGQQIYDVAIQFPIGKPAANTRFLILEFVRPVTFPANFSSAQGKCLTNPTATATFTIEKTDRILERL
jgi:hypothetical protein